MENMWAWLSGKKTIIGCSIVSASYLLVKIAGIWELDYFWISKTAETMDLIGAIIASGGLTHKVIKSNGKQYTMQ